MRLPVMPPSDLIGEQRLNAFDVPVPESDA